MNATFLSTDLFRVRFARDDPPPKKSSLSNRSKDIQQMRISQDEKTLKGNCEVVGSPGYTAD